MGALLVTLNIDAAMNGYSYFDYNYVSRLCIPSALMSVIIAVHFPRFAFLHLLLAVEGHVSIQQ